MKFAVVGHPIAHSKSPAMHTAAYRALDLPHSYEAIDVDETHFADFLNSLKHGDFQGINVTVPHKARAYELADERAPSAIAVGAANTLVRDAAGKIIAHNTDVGALEHELQSLDASRDWSKARALVVGAGGAARAALVALRDLGVKKIVVVARRVECAKAMGTLAPIEVVSFDEGKHHDLDVVVQATSSGMQGADDGKIVASCIDWKRVPKGAVAYDVVYAPRETEFLRAARDAGISAANGIGMLARQGAIAFELWLGIPAPLAVMRAALGE
jgi:shikimate dehydrogenase